jgi:hypothetical protein
VNGEFSSDPETPPTPERNPQRPRSPRQVWLGLGLVIIVFVALATTIAIKTPAWESGDEPDHVQNNRQEMISPLISSQRRGTPILGMGDGVGGPGTPGQPMRRFRFRR